MIFLFSSFSRAGGCVKGVLVFMADWNVLAQSVHVCPSPLLWEENHEGETMDERKVQLSSGGDQQFSSPTQSFSLKDTEVKDFGNKQW